MRVFRVLFLIAGIVAAATAHAGAPVATIGIFNTSALFNFGSLAPGASATQSVGFFAPGTNTSPVQVTAYSMSGSPAFTSTGNCVGTTLFPGDTCTQTVTFTATGSGSASASVNCITVVAVLVGAMTFSCNDTPFTLSFIGGIVQAVPALDPTLVAALSGALLLWGALFLVRRNAARH
ncbi:MAG: hypothetical protein JSR18_03580 [Proteobacteria bacterium]|nr:hypothetical protein [Pseudomonadota bacterium]